VSNYQMSVSDNLLLCQCVSDNFCDTKCENWITM